MAPWARRRSGGQRGSKCWRPERSSTWVVGPGPPDFNGRVVVGLDPVIEMVALSPVRDRVVGTGESLPFREGSLDAVFSGFVFRNLSSVTDTLAEIDRVLKPGSTAVVVDLARPRNGALRVLHRIGSALLLPLVGLGLRRRPPRVLVPSSIAPWIPSPPLPETLFSGHALIAEHIWRMGVFGFVYGVRLRKAPP